MFDRDSYKYQTRKVAIFHYTYKSARLFFTYPIYIYCKDTSISIRNPRWTYTITLSWPNDLYLYFTTGSHSLSLKSIRGIFLQDYNDNLNTIRQHRDIVIQNSCKSSRKI
jgi:hypothetical protein